VTFPRRRREENAWRSAHPSRPPRPPPLQPSRAEFLRGRPWSGQVGVSVGWIILPIGARSTLHTSTRRSSLSAQHSGAHPSGHQPPSGLPNAAPAPSLSPLMAASSRLRAWVNGGIPWDTRAEAKPAPRLGGCFRWVFFHRHIVPSRGVTPPPLPSFTTRFYPAYDPNQDDDDTTTRRHDANASCEPRRSRLVRARRD
jgi:hypothetical protein